MQNKITENDCIIKLQIHRFLWYVWVIKYIGLKKMIKIVQTTTGNTVAIELKIPILVPDELIITTELSSS